MVGASGSLHSSSIPNTWKAACGIKAARHVRLANQRIPLSHKISAQSAQQSCCVGKRKFPSQLPSAVVAPAVQQEVTLACLDPLGSCLELRQRLVPRHHSAPGGASRGSTGPATPPRLSAPAAGGAAGCGPGPRPAPAPPAGCELCCTLRTCTSAETPPNVLATLDLHTAVPNHESHILYTLYIHHVAGVCAAVL